MYVLLPSLLLTACSYVPVNLRPLPSMDVQKAHIKHNELIGQILTLEAFMQAWGTPTYEHGEQAQFLPADNGNWVPSFRTPLG